MDPDRPYSVLDVAIIKEKFKIWEVIKTKMFNLVKQNNDLHKLSKKVLK